MLYIYIYILIYTVYYFILPGWIFAGPNANHMAT